MGPIRHRGQDQYAERQKALSNAYRQRGDRNQQWNDFRREWYATSERAQIDAPIAGPARESGSSPESQGESTVMEQDVVDAGADGMSNSLAGGSRSVGKQNEGYWDIPRSLSSKPVFMTFKKSRIFYSYGYAFKQITKSRNINNVDKGDNVYYTTPLAILPNHTIGFYMDKHEINLMGAMASRCVEARCTVVPQGLRATFDTGTTLTGSATSEHVAFGVSGIGINHKMYVRGCKYTANSTAPMIPTDFKDVVLEDIMVKLYGTAYKSDEKNIPMILGTPRHLDTYMAIVTNSDRKVGNYATHDEGPNKLDEYIDRWNFLPKCGQKIIDWKYKCRNGHLNLKPHDIPCYDGENLGFLDRALHANMSRVGIVSQAQDGVPLISPENEIMQGTLRTKLNQYQHIDDLTAFALDNKISGSSKSIPLITFGVLPIPAINPTLDTTNFLNVAGTWSVVCELTIELDYNSCYAQGKASHCTPDNVLVRPSGYGEVTGMNDFDVFANVPMTTSTTTLPTELSEAIDASETINVLGKTDIYNLVQAAPETVGESQPDTKKLERKINEMRRTFENQLQQVRNESRDQIQKVDANVRRLFPSPTAPTSHPTTRQ